MTATRSSRNAPLAATAALALIGLLVVVVAVIYLTKSAQALPSFFPGHQAGDSHHDTKHGLAAAVVALICFAGTWSSTGTRRPVAV